MKIIEFFSDYFDYFQRCNGSHYANSAALTILYCAITACTITMVPGLVFREFNLKFNEYFLDAMIFQVLLILFCFWLRKIFSVENGEAGVCEGTIFERFIKVTCSGPWITWGFLIFYSLVIFFNWQFYTFDLEFFFLLVQFGSFMYFYMLYQLTEPKNL